MIENVEFKFMKPEVKLLTVTPDAEKHMAYCARVSNPANQENDNFSGLLKYCIKHQHWSIFEQAFRSLLRLILLVVSQRKF
jgi:hypothetical protein